MKTNLRKINIFVSALLFLAMALGLAMPVQTARAASLTVCASGCDYTTIQAAVTAASPTGDTINVAAGTYDEDLTINKSLSLIGAGASSTNIRGVIGGGSSTIQVGGSNVTIAGFTITRLGNNLTDWNNPGLNTGGIAIQGTANTGAVIHDNIITGNRTGIDINDSSGHTIRNNVITDNRTGMIFRNQTDNLAVVENEITNNWTVGILFLDASTGQSNVPVQTALNCTFSNNNLSGNWYGQVVDRQTGGSLPLPGANLKNFSGNWYGTTTPFVSTTNSTEPGYAAQIPVEFGGTAVAPGGMPDILGTASANIDFTPYLNSGTDTNVETISGRGTYGFQGNFSNLWVTAAGAQTGTTGRIQEGINSVSGSTVNIADGLYIASNTTINKPLTLQGQSQSGVVIAPAAEDGNVDSAFATNAQNGLVVAAHNVTIKNLTIDGRGNPGLTVGKNNFRAGIVTLDASQSGGGAWNNLNVDNVFIKYAYRRGISVFPTTVSGTVIENSRVEYIAYNHCMYLAGQSQALNNTLKHCFQGIVEALDPTTPAGTSVVTGNTIIEIGNFPGVWGDQGPLADPRYQGQPRAIQFNNSDSAGRTVEIRDNVINDVGSEGLGGTVGIYTRLANSASIVDNNTITLTSGTSWAIDGGSQSVGMLLGWSYANGFIASNNHVNSSGYGMGVMVFGAGTLAKPMVLEGNTITATSSTRDTQGDGTGIYIANQYLFASDKNESYVIIRNGNAISGFVRGIDVEKVITSTQPLTVTANRNLIAGNTTGIDASTLSAAIDATNNWWGAASGPLDNKTLPNTPNYNNPLGTGNAVSAYVDYKTWCVDTSCINPSPFLPSTFHGYFHYIGTQPAVGTTIEAYVNDVTAPVKTTTVFEYLGDRVYQFDVPAATPGAPKDGGKAGDTVTFKIAGRIVATAPWISGTDTLLNFHPPEAVPGAYNGLVGSTITLTGLSNDWGSDATTYMWDLDGGTNYVTPNPASFSKSTIGSYPVGLKVTDDQHGEGTATSSVIVIDVAGRTGQTYDGTPKSVTVTGDPGTPIITYIGADPTHTDAGSYALTITTSNGAVLTGLTMVIDPKPVTVTPNSGQNKLVGSPDPVFTYTSSDPLATFSGLLSRDLGETPGTYPIRQGTLLGTGNYTIGSFVSVDFYIQTTCTNSLVSGWNLVSLCLAQVDPAAPGTVLSSLSGKYDLVYGWDGSVATNNWLKFAPGGPGYANDLTRLDEKMGFWIHMTQATTLTVTGYPPSATDINVYSVAPGSWNLLGFPKAGGTLLTTPLPDIMRDHGLADFTLVYAYHAYDTGDLWKLFDNRPGVPPFASDLKFMEPAWGYWVQASGVTQTWHVVY